MTTQYIPRLQEELLRVTSQKGMYHQFTLPNGNNIQGATESEVKEHLTSRRDFVDGREFSFPGISNGWNFESAIEDAGFRCVRARNYRNQICNVITI